MSTATYRARRTQRRVATRRRRLASVVSLIGLAAVLAGAAGIAGIGPLADEVREITLPLRHEDIIRQQAADKGVDAALIAAVIYEESKFRDLTSHAGARGLMQITPQTADYIADQVGRHRVRAGRPAIAADQHRVRGLVPGLPERQVRGRDVAAVAAYNAGEGTVDEWVETAGGLELFDKGDIQFPETREYVDGVMDHRGAYRKHYDDELGY